MKYFYIFLLIALWGCGDKEVSYQTTSDDIWSLSEPQIANKKGRIFLTNVQHHQDEPLQLTDNLIFDTNDKNLDLKFTTLTRCYDSDQSELSETKSFAFEQQIPIQKLMPKQALHPNYIIKKQDLNCTFKFKVEKPNGSSHNFRLYSQSVSLTEQLQNPLIDITGDDPKEEYKVIHIQKLNEEYFTLPDLGLSSLELICQSFKLNYLSQINKINPFYGFNVKSFEGSVYPRELCRIVGKKQGDYILSKPFQIEFNPLQVTLAAAIPQQGYSYTNKNTEAIKIMVTNPHAFQVTYQVEFPDDVSISKMGTVYKKAFQVQYDSKFKISKVRDKAFILDLGPGESAEFSIMTDLTRVCYSEKTFVEGHRVIRDTEAEIYFAPESILVKSFWHKNFIFKTQIKQSNYLAINLKNNDYPPRDEMPSIQALRKKSSIRSNFKPNTSNQCKNTAPHVNSTYGRLRETF